MAGQCLLRLPTLQTLMLTQHEYPHRAVPLKEMEFPLLVLFWETVH